MHIIKHFNTITKHRLLVLRYCFKCGLIKQGLCHDLSKYSFVEFFNGAKYYQGTYSPNHNERLDKGYSEAWLHHKGRNKHHSEYWVEINPQTHKYEPVPMPIKYAIESVCDRIAASVIYNKKNYTKDIPLNYFYKELAFLPMHENTKALMEELLIYYRDHTDKEAFKYFKNIRKKKLYCC
ncbi:MAG: DUF5662 family protein [Anaeroplasma sp.]|nr:DUF5662 family protein [Anaeroplasma sp.]